MKCFQVVQNDVVVGLPVRYLATRRPHVCIGRVEVGLSNELLVSNPGQRLFDCDLERREDGTIVFVPSRGESGNVLVGYSLTWRCQDRQLSMTGPETGTLIVNDGNGQANFLNSLYNEGVLARMARGCVLSVRMCKSVLEPKHTGFAGLVRDRRFIDQVTDQDFLKLNEQGEPVFCPNAQQPERPYVADTDGCCIQRVYW